MAQLDYVPDKFSGHVKDFLNANFDTFQETASGVNVCCPVHDDNTPSLNVVEAEDGKILLHCFSGCENTEIVDALGLSMMDLYPKPGNILTTVNAPCTVSNFSKRKQLPIEYLRSKGVTSGTWAGNSCVEYTHYMVDGNEYGRKRVRKSLEGKNHTTWDRNTDKGTIPYGLECITAAQKKGYIHIVEGESDRLTLDLNGFPVIAIPGATNVNVIQIEHVKDIKKIYAWQEDDKAGSTVPGAVEKRLNEIGWDGEVLVIRNFGANDTNDLWRLDNKAFKSTVSLLMDKAYKAGVESQPSDNVDHSICLSDVREEKIEWVWQGRLAIGKMTMLDGDGGVGKTMLYNNIAARITSGEPMPDGEAIEKGSVLFIAPEDGVADTIKPRMIEAGADMDKVFVLNTIKKVEHGKPVERTVSLPQDLDILESTVVNRNIKLLVIDPILAMINTKVDSHKDQAIRTVLTPLSQMAERTRCSIILVRHLNKGESSNLMYRGGGSIAFVSACRTALMVIPDVENQGRYVLTRYKGNIGKKPADLVYHIEANPGNESRAIIVWDGESNRDIKTVMGSNATGDTTKRLLSIINSFEGEFSLGELQEELNDIQPTTVRVTLTRLRASGQVVALARGKYCSVEYDAKKRKADQQISEIFKKQQ